MIAKLTGALIALVMTLAYLVAVVAAAPAAPAPAAPPAATAAAAAAVAPATRAKPGDKIQEVRDLNMVLIRVEPGEFVMGSPADEAGRDQHELRHEVSLTKPFYLQSTEMSQAQYKALMGENPSNFKGDELPVETVSWHAAALF